MNKIKKIVVAMLVACVTCLVSVFALVGCGDDEEPAKKDPVLKSIAVTKQPDKVVYVSGSDFDSTGMEVTAYYDDEKSKVLAATDYTCNAPSLTVEAGQFETTKSVSVSYTEKSVKKTASFDVTVTNKVTAVDIIDEPDVTVYLVGETFDPSGLKISATYEDGTDDEVLITTANAQFSVTTIADDTEKVTVTYGGYDFDVEITVEVESEEKKVELDSADIATPDVRLENIGGKPYIVIGGGAYTATVEGYDLSSATDKVIVDKKIAAAIKESYYFEALNNPIGGIEGYNTLIENGSHTVNILDGNLFEVRCDLSALTAGGIYGVRFVKTTPLDEDEDATEINRDFNSTHFPAFTKLELKTLIVDSVRYDAFYNDDNSGHEFDWDCLAIAVSEAVPSFADKSVTLEQNEETGKVYLVIGGEYNYYTADDLKVELAKANGDYRYDPQLGNAAEKDVPFAEENIIYTVTAGEYGGTYELRIELTDFTPGTAFFHLDYAAVEEGTNLRLPLKNGEVMFELEELDRKITLFITKDTGTSYGWADGLVAIKIIDTTAKEVGKVGPAAIQQDGDKVYLVLTGDCTGYTAEEIKEMITELNFEPSHGDKTLVVADKDDIDVTVADGKYIIKYDVTTLGAVFDDKGNIAGYWTHLKPFGADDQPGDGAGNIGNDNGTTAVTVDGRSYSYKKYDFGWGQRYILTIELTDRSFAVEKAEFITEGENIYYAVTFATNNMRLSEIKRWLHHIDLQPTSGDRINYSGDSLIFGEVGADGKVIVKIDITSVGVGVYVPHCFVVNDYEEADNKINYNGKDICVDINNTEYAIGAVTFGEKTYEVKETTVEGWGNWTAYLLNVT